MSATGGIERRKFLKYTAYGALAAAAVASGVVYPIGLARFAQYGRKPWEVERGVVEYDLVPDYSGKVPGRPNTFNPSDFPESKKTLKVAQWYDYWPGSVVNDFATWMNEKRRISGISVEWTSNIYTANEELFTWVTQTGRKFDVMVPTNYTVETLEKAGQLVNMNKDWIPNYINIFGTYDSRLPAAYDFGGYNNPGHVDFRNPDLNGYAYRSNSQTYPDPRGKDVVTWNEQNSLLAIPYQWGTTGIGYRYDIFDPADIESLGWQVFELDSYTNPKTGTTYALHRKRMMLDDMREVFTAALKETGWHQQQAAGIPPTATPHEPSAPWLGEYQWSANEVADDKLGAARAWLLSWINDSWGFNTPQQGPWLVSKQMFVDQAWSGDVIYAIRPYSFVAPPVTYFVPDQGGARWIDNLAIHRESENLWLAHQFVNYILEETPRWGVGSAITSWNSYATPNGPSFYVLHENPKFTYPNGWNQTTDRRIYADIAVEPKPSWAPRPGPPILNRTEYQKDVGVRNTLKYFQSWRTVKF